MIHQSTHRDRVSREQGLPDFEDDARVYRTLETFGTKLLLAIHIKIQLIFTSGWMAREKGSDVGVNSLDRAVAHKIVLDGTYFYGSSPYLVVSRLAQTSSISRVRVTS